MSGLDNYMTINLERLGVAKKKIVQTPRAPIFNRLRDGVSHVKTGSSVDTKKKESTSCMSVWHQIKHTNVENCHGSLNVKRHDVILTNLDKEGSDTEQVKPYVITSP
ncbi:gypsy-like retrotransposase [Cucumis melo var. makuwa]|uniref:Gypsy-like retrotransposase n=1 Tax=Cucumis melo var. makuwa TaxID=1194695 RepID=A0A5D3C8H8_CUCMM|nr:gypsy-like retrotransposase [Cucumis melo var. makuwa]TYK07785.1 gypsy-like retrotransposase [Cucumis melo var. makuwa]